MAPSVPAVPPDNNRGARRARRGRRETVKAACNFCCARKIKCDAGRPHCSACLTRGRLCVYDTKDDLETRGAATKRRCEDLERQLEALSLLRCDACKEQAEQYASQKHDQDQQERQQQDDDEEVDDEDEEQLQRDDTTNTILWPPDVMSSTNVLSLPDYEESVTLQAAEILSALLNSTDEDSTGILAALRVGLPWNSAQQLSSSSSMLNDAPGSWLGQNPASSSAGYNADDSVRSNPISAQDIDSIMTFDRRLWVHELVIYNEPTPNNIKHIPVRRSPSGERQDSSPRSRSTRTYPHSVTNTRGISRLPLYALVSMVDVGDARCPFVKAYIELTREIDSGTDIKVLFGSHVYLSALNNREMYLKAPRLSQIVASMAISMKLEGDEGHVPRTRCALMWLHWLLWQWLLDTSATSFLALPEMLRPTPWQLSVAHPLVFDFVSNPAMRDHLCRLRTYECQWLTQACVSVSCDNTPDDFYVHNASTGELDLSDEAKAHIALPESWSFGASVRPFFYNLDKYIRVRPPTTAKAG